MRSKQSGFTLIELLVVISIIGVLAAVVLVSLNSTKAKARDVARLASKRQVITALRLYYESNGHYPLSATGGADWSCLAPVGETCWRGGYSALASLVTDFAPYMSMFPVNNATPGQYAYDRLIYISNYPGCLMGQCGAFLMWVKEQPMTASECGSAYGYTHQDNYWYCYEYIGQ